MVGNKKQNKKKPTKKRQGEPWWKKHVPDGYAKITRKTQAREVKGKHLKPIAEK